MSFLGFETFVTAVAYHFRLKMHTTFSQPGMTLLAAQARWLPSWGKMISPYFSLPKDESRIIKSFVPKSASRSGYQKPMHGWIPSVGGVCAFFFAVVLSPDSDGWSTDGGKLLARRPIPPPCSESRGWLWFAGKEFTQPLGRGSVAPVSLSSSFLHVFIADAAN